MIITLETGGLAAVIVCFMLAVLVGNLFLARVNRR